MGANPSEVRNLPRNRKCGNCRFYEPAPLWRKGWCRNPRLYPPHANHLVDATTIDCEGGFRSRIYWEPLPLAEPVPQVEKERPLTRTIQFQAPPEPMPPPIPVVQSTRSVSDLDNPIPPPAYEPPLVLAELVSGAGASEVAPPGPDWRQWVRQRAPFTAKWPLEKIQLDQRTVLPAAVLAVVLLVALGVIIGNLTKKSEPDPLIAASVTQTAARQATATAQTALRTTLAASITTVAATPTPALKTALIKGTGATPLNVREEPNLKGKLVLTLKEGEKVTVLDGPKDSDGRGWYKIEYNGKTGWAAKDYLELQV